MERRKFTREFKLEAVRLIKERGVGVAQASRDLDVHQMVLRNWVRDFGVSPEQRAVSAACGIRFGRWIIDTGQVGIAV